MTGRVVAGRGMVDEVGSAVGRNGDRQADTECRGAGDQPAQRPWRYRESGADAGGGEAASGTGAASGRCRASPRSRRSAAGLLGLRREMPRQGLAASSGRDAIRRSDRAAAAISLHWLWPHRNGYQLAIALSVDTGAGPAPSASFRPHALSRGGWRAAASSAGRGREEPRDIARPYAQGRGASSQHRGQAGARRVNCYGHRGLYLHSELPRRRTASGGSRRQRRDTRWSPASVRRCCENRYRPRGADPPKP